MNAVELGQLLLAQLQQTGPGVPVVIREGIGGEINREIQSVGIGFVQDPDDEDAEDPVIVITIKELDQ